MPDLIFCFLSAAFGALLFLVFRTPNLALFLVIAVPILLFGLAGFATSAVASYAVLMASVAASAWLALACLNRWCLSDEDVKSLERIMKELESKENW